MIKTGKELEFISLILRDGSGTVKVGGQSSYDNHAQVDNVDYLDNQEFECMQMSITNDTYIAIGFNAWVVKLK